MDIGDDNYCASCGGEITEEDPQATCGYCGAVCHEKGSCLDYHEADCDDNPDNNLDDEGEEENR